MRTCTYCKQYYDGRDSYKNNDDGKCVWLPGKGVCNTKKLVKDSLGVEFVEDCDGNVNFNKI